jgi:hypothetical protein
VEQLQPTTPAQEASVPETVVTPDDAADPHPLPATSGPAPPGRGRAWALGAVVVVALALVVWIGWSFLGDGDETSATDDDTPSSSSPRSSRSEGDLEILQRARVEVMPSGEEARFQLALYQGDPYLVMQLEADGGFHMAANLQIACPLEAGSTDIRLEADQDYEGVEPDTGQGYVGWAGPDGEVAYSTYFGWDVKEKTLELFGDTPEEGCAAAS